MQDNKDMYRNAADQAVTEGERYGSWWVYGYYQVQEIDHDAIAVATRTVPKDVKPARGPQDIQYPNQDGEWVRDQRVNIVDSYMPLADKDYANLFDRFARLGDRGEIGRQTWLEWLHQYGALGVREPGPAGIATSRNMATDVYSRFVREARKANQTMKLFGAATAPGGPHIERISKLLPEEYREYASGGPVELKQAALFAVQDTAERKVHADCYLRLLPRLDGEGTEGQFDDEGRKRQVSPFLREWGFDSLLGAMWLQFMWFASINGPRYCAAPGCSNPISPYDRSDKITCSERCRKRRERERKR